MPDGVVERIGRLTSIDTLDLTACPVTDNGLAYLVGLKWLRKLSLSGSKVARSGLKHLMPLKELRFLDLTETRVTKNDVQQLHEVLPELNIYGGSGRTTWEVGGGAGNFGSIGDRKQLRATLGMAPRPPTPRTTSIGRPP